MVEAIFEKTQLGQFLYDLAFTDLSPKYLARKHGLPQHKISGLRKAVIKALRKPIRTRDQRADLVQRAIELNSVLERRSQSFGGHEKCHDPSKNG